jgi:hypothetical protein
MSFVGIAFGNNQYVTVGYNGTIYTSPDAITWTKRTSGTKQYLRSVVYGNNTYVVVGDSGTILTSSDGITWASRYSGIKYELSGITFGSNLFITVSMYGNILSSTDGITWINRATTKYSLMCIAYGNNTFVTGGGGSNYASIYSSHDGLTWKNQSLNSVFLDEIDGLAFGANWLVAVNVSGEIASSLDTGKGWKNLASDKEGLSCAAYGNNIFVAGGDAIYTSPAVNAIRYSAPKTATNQLLTITNNTAKFTLTHTANTNLTLFDLSGRPVASLLSGQKAAGAYCAALPAKLPQGRYLLSLKSGEASCVTPVMITR